MPVLSTSQTWNERAEFASASGPGRATYLYSPEKPKPCFHPLITPRGRTLTGNEFSDHVWHRGLWFAIKYINRSNFWEENAPYGVQRSVDEPRVEMTGPQSARITHRLEWTSEATGVALNETRVITVCPDVDGVGSITWDAGFDATQDLELDRTPFTTWGGYAGLSYRAAREIHNAKFMIPGGEMLEALTGQPHDWVVMQGQVDGGKKEYVSLGIVDHPENPRSPSPWYCKSGNGFNFMNAAFLFHGPLSVKAGEHLRFRYQVFYRDGIWTADEFQSLAAGFRAGKASK